MAPKEKWVGGTKSVHADPVPSWKWGRHKKTILQFYASMTLKEVRETMHAEYNFSATLSQYVHQLKRWDVRKENGQIFLRSKPFTPSRNIASNTLGSALPGGPHIPRRETPRPEPVWKDQRPGSELLELSLLSASGSRSISISTKHEHRFQSKIETAADLLFNLCCYDDALPLYRHLCRNLGESKHLTARLLRSAPSYILCAPQDEFNVDDSRLYYSNKSEIIDGIFRLYRVLVSMDTEGGLTRLIRYFAQNDTQILHGALKHLSMADPSLDLEDYPLLLHYIWITINKRGSRYFFDCDYTRDNDESAKEVLITLCPGPFEVKDGVLQNDCLKSCLRWCQGRIASVLASADAYAFWLGGLQAVGALYSSYGPEFALFCYLWESWQADNDVVPSICLEERMGLSAEHVLKAICDMLTRMNDGEWCPASALPWKSYMSHLLQICVSLFDKDERDLAISFVDAFKWRREDEDQHLFSKVPFYVRRNYARSVIEDYLTLPLSELLLARDHISSTTTRDTTLDISERRSSEPRFSILSRASKVTLATSISSSNSTLASFKRIRDLARDTMRHSASTGGTRVSAIDEEVQTLSDRLSILSVKTVEHAENFDNEKRSSKTRKSGSLSRVAISSPTLIGSSAFVVEGSFE